MPRTYPINRRGGKHQDPNAPTGIAKVIVQGMGSRFQCFIGIDYSGQGASDAGQPGIRAFEGRRDTDPREIPPARGAHWSRTRLAEWLVGELLGQPRALVGIDHGFSLPCEIIADVEDWDGLLEAQCRTWPSRRIVTKANIRRAFAGMGKPLRLTERWTSSAKSVVDCDGPGVACSTFAGLPWLLHIRTECGERVHFWPFDGWDPPAEKHVIAEVYPSIFRNRYRRDGLEGDRLDAFAVAAWMRDMDARGALDRYFNPPLTSNEKVIAAREGWILGVC